jgi:hypothetical protein
MTFATNLGQKSVVAYGWAKNVPSSYNTTRNDWVCGQILTFLINFRSIYDKKLFAVKP